MNEDLELINNNANVEEDKEKRLIVKENHSKKITRVTETNNILYKDHPDDINEATSVQYSEDASSDRNSKRMAIDNGILCDYVNANIKVEKKSSLVAKFIESFCVEKVIPNQLIITARILILGCSVENIFIGSFRMAHILIIKINLTIS